MSTKKADQAETAIDEQAVPETDAAKRIDMNDPSKTAEEAVAENLGN